MRSRSPLCRLAVASGALAVAVGLTGCAEPAAPTGGLALVVGARSNMPVVSVGGAAAAALEGAVGAQSDLSLLVAAGAPFELDAWSLEVSDENPQAADADRAAHRARINQHLATAAARTPEVDLLTALELGARSVSSAGGGHTLVVVDSGLSTVAPLDFTGPGLLDADPAELAAALQAAGQLPDLTGVDVVFQGLGDTADPQPALGRAQRANLVAIWTAIVQAAGADGAQVEEAPLGGAAADGLPPVSVVPPGSSVQCTAGTVVLTGGDVAFAADSAAFADRAAAAATLEPIAAQMADGGLTATVTGTTARVGDLAGQRALSLQRAQAVADLLADLGVPAGALAVVGLGSEFPGYVPDSDAAGALVPAAAASNRKVVLDLAGASADVTCALG